MKNPAPKGRGRGRPPRERRHRTSYSDAPFLPRGATHPIDHPARITPQQSPAIRLPGSFAAVLFDLDGLLVRTEDLWWQAKVILFERYGVEFRPTDHVAVFGTSDAFTAAYFARRFGLPADAEDEIRDAYLTIAAGMFAAGVDPSDGATLLLEKLRHRVPLGLVSNTRRSQVLETLGATPFGDAFDVVVTGDDGEPKPAPDLYLLACSRLGVRPERVVALEDSPTGVRAAKAAGLTCIGVPSHLDEGLDGADIVVTSLAELARD